MKFGRKSTPATDAAEIAGQEVTPPAEETPRVGPFDAEDVPDDGVARVDLGSMLVAPVPGSELRLQIDERTQQVQSVLLAGAEGALELRAFAAPRNGDLWSEIRPQLAADMARRGGTATEREGRFGPELVCQLTVKTPDGRTGSDARSRGASPTAPAPARGWGAGAENAEWDADYVWSFAVAEVPEPAVFVLFLFGIVAAIPLSRLLAIRRPFLLSRTKGEWGRWLQAPRIPARILKVSKASVKVGRQGAP